MPTSSATDSSAMVPDYFHKVCGALSKKSTRKRRRSTSEDGLEQARKRLRQIPAPLDLTHVLANFNSLNLRSTRPSLESLPNELLINIFGHLRGRATDFRSVMLTCRHLHSLLTRHDHIIVSAMISGSSLPEKIMLFNLAKTTTNWSPFGWLESGQRRNGTIDRVLFHLERAGAFQDENHIFRRGTTHYQNPSHARRVLRTILLAVETISMQGDWQAMSDYVMKKNPDLLNSFACHLEGLIRYVVYNAYMYIRDLDARMNGTNDLDPPFGEGIFWEFVLYLHERVLKVGPSLLLELFEMKPKFANYNEFWRWLVDPWLGKRNLPDPGVGTLGLFLEDVSYEVELEHDTRWLGQHNTFGIKHCGDLDLTKWSKAVPDEKTWAGLMYERGWVGPERSVRKLLRLPSPA